MFCYLFYCDIDGCNFFKSASLRPSHITLRQYVNHWFGTTNGGILTVLTVTLSLNSYVIVNNHEMYFL
jgi:hypothetical protein